MNTTTTHRWNSQFCSCGQDTVTCQITGHLVCGSLTQWLEPLGNVCQQHSHVSHPDTLIAIVSDPRLRQHLQAKA